jgi:spoIIIJ-associated protein
MTQRQFEGRSAAEAAIKACEVLGLTRSALRYEMVSDTGEKMARRVVISVDVSTPPPAAPPVTAPVTAPAPRSNARPAPEVGRYAPPPSFTPTREGNFALSQEADMPARRNRIPERVGRGDRRSRGGSTEGRDSRERDGRDRDGREGRPGRGERSASRGERNDRPERTHDRPAHAEAGGKERSGGRSRRSEGRSAEPRSDGRSAASAGRERSRGRSRERPAAGGRQQDDNGIEALLSMEASHIAVVRRAAIAPGGPRSVHTLQVATDLCRHMHMDLQPTLVAEDEAEMHIDLVGSDESRIIGRKGEVLLALQFVLNRIISRGEVEGEQVVVLDAGGYRERRRVALQELATKLAHRALEERKAVRLSPMSAHDRRIFHMTLKEIEGVATRSEGDGLYRNLLIIPAEFC